MTVRICNPGTGIYVCPAGGVAGPGEVLDVPLTGAVEADLARGRVVLVTKPEPQDATRVDVVVVDEVPSTPSRQGRSRKPNRQQEGD